MSKSILNSKVRETLELKPTEGSIGIEIEVESNRLPPRAASTGLPSGWKDCKDGSLRGHSREYVLRRPMTLTNANRAVDDLRKTFEDLDVKVKQSFRAGVHVHINVQRYTFEEVAQAMLLYYVYEELLVKFCGNLREGNHFCLRLKDAEYPLILLENMIKKGDPWMLRTENIRYASLNAYALYKFGSLEFRAMETRPNFEGIKEWTTMLYMLTQYGRNLKNRQELAEKISYMGPLSLLKTIIGDDLYKMLNPTPEDEVKCMINLRACQNTIYAQAKV